MAAEARRRGVSYWQVRKEHGATWANPHSLTCSPVPCSRCDQPRADNVGLTLPDGEFGFCSSECFVDFACDRWLLAPLAVSA